MVESPLKKKLDDADTTKVIISSGDDQIAISWPTAALDFFIRDENGIVQATKGPTFVSLPKMPTIDTLLLLGKICAIESADELKDAMGPEYHFNSSIAVNDQCLKAICQKLDIDYDCTECSDLIGGIKHCYSSTPIQDLQETYNLHLEDMDAMRGKMDQSLEMLLRKRIWKIIPADNTNSTVTQCNNNTTGIDEMTSNLESATLQDHPDSSAAKTDDEDELVEMAFDDEEFKAD
ncbi:hypothetical protein F5Y16DRAFT_401485 [Xylariaceae sp. FL0255]|nr:hypothetical protein F5Y16DRAFT_401485 [Xylariaceae sp. FL0255]